MKKSNVLELDQIGENDINCKNENKNKGFYRKIQYLFLSLVSHLQIVLYLYINQNIPNWILNLILFNL